MPCIHLHAHDAQNGTNGKAVHKEIPRKHDELQRRKNIIEPVAEEDGEIDHISVSLDIEKRVAQTDTRLILFVVFRKAFAADVILGLDLNGYDFQPILNQEVYFGLIPLKRPVVGSLETLCKQRTKHEILCHRALKLI